MNSFEAYRVGQGKSEEVLEYYENWLAQIKEKQEKYLAKKAEYEQWKKAHPIKAFFIDWDGDSFDFDALFYDIMIRELNKAVAEARYNVRNNVEFTRVHSDFFVIEE